MHPPCKNILFSTYQERSRSLPGSFPIRIEIFSIRIRVQPGWEPIQKNSRAVPPLSFAAALCLKAVRARRPKESVGFRACQAIFDAEGCESRLRCLIQGGESGVWPGLVGCCATRSHPGAYRRGETLRNAPNTMHPGQMRISPTHDAIFGYAENR